MSVIGNAVNGMLTMMLAKFMLNDLPHATGMIPHSHYDDPPTGPQLSYIARLCIRTKTTTIHEERVTTFGEAGRVISELKAEEARQKREKRIKKSNPVSGLTIRRSTVERELDAIERARAQIASDMDTRMQSSYSIVGDIMGYYYDSDAVIAERNGELVGIATYVTAHNHDYNIDEARIQELASLTYEPGVGKAIVEEIIKIAKEQSASLVTVNYGPGARGFYERLGFIEDVRYVEGRPEALVLKLNPSSPTVTLYHGTSVKPEIIRNEGLRPPRPDYTLNFLSRQLGIPTSTIDADWLKSAVGDRIFYDYLYGPGGTSRRTDKSLFFWMHKPPMFPTGEYVSSDLERLALEMAHSSTVVISDDEVRSMLFTDIPSVVTVRIPESWILFTEPGFADWIAGLQAAGERVDTEIEVARPIPPRYIVSIESVS